MINMASLRAEIEKRGRWSQIVAIVDPPETFEIDAAIYDALDDINSWEPNTTYSLEWVLSNPDTRWLKLLYDGAAYRIVDMMVKDWTANGVNVDLGDGVALESKLGDYSTLREALKTQFDEGIERLKQAALKRSRVRTFSTSRTPQSTSMSRRVSSVFKMSKIT